MRITVAKRISFSAGHRLMGHEGRCANIHGHNYLAEFHVTGDELDSVGRIVDFSVLEQRLGSWIEDNWSHACVLYREDDEARKALSMVESQKLYLLDANPSVENMALHLLQDICPAQLSDLPVRVTKIVLWEGQQSFCEVSAE